MCVGNRDRVYQSQYEDCSEGRVETNTKLKIHFVLAMLSVEVTLLEVFKKKCYFWTEIDHFWPQINLSGLKTNI